MFEKPFIEKYAKDFITYLLSTETRPFSMESIESVSTRSLQGGFSKINESHAFIANKNHFKELSEPHHVHKAPGFEIISSEASD